MAFSADQLKPYNCDPATLKAMIWKYLKEKRQDSALVTDSTNKADKAPASEQVTAPEGVPAGPKPKATKHKKQDSAPVTGSTNKADKAPASEQVATPEDVPAGAKPGFPVHVPIGIDHKWDYVSFDLQKAKQLQNCKGNNTLFATRYMITSFIPKKEQRVHESMKGK